jgi:hypothetical protein
MGGYRRSTLMLVNMQGIASRFPKSESDLIFVNYSPAPGW